MRIQSCLLVVSPDQKLPDLLSAVAGLALSSFQQSSVLPPGLQWTGKVTSSSNAHITAEGRGAETPFSPLCYLIAAPIKAMDKEKAETVA